MKHSMFPTFLNIAIIAMTSLIASTLLLAANRAYVELETLKNSPVIVAFLKDEVGESEALELTSQISLDGRIRALKYISKSEALKTSQKRFAQYPALLSNLTTSNPLPASIEVSLKDETLEVATITEIANKLSALKEVEDVTYDLNIPTSIQNVKLLLSIVGGVLGASVGLIVLLSNAFWAAYRRKEGSFSKIRAFFFGAFVTILGDFAGISICYGIYYTLSLELDIGSFLSNWQVVSLSGAMAVLGALGALIGSFGKDRGGERARG